MAIETLASEIAREIHSAAGEQPSDFILGNFSFAGVVCEIRVPDPGWTISFHSQVTENASLTPNGFRLWELFSSDEPPQLVANVLVHPRAEAWAASAWKQCPFDAGPGNRKSFSCNGSDFLIYQSILARLRRAQGTLDILLGLPEHFRIVPSVIRFALSLILNDSGAIILHSTGLVSCGKALVFFGVSGTGKSTMARLSAADTVLSDEAVIVHRRDHAWLASGTPFHSELGAGSNTTAELAALVKLTKAPFNRCHALTERMAVQELLKVAIVLDDQPAPKVQCAHNVLSAVEGVPAYELEFRPEPAVWPFVLKELEHLWRT
jgi:hypothetical protein